MLVWVNQCRETEGEQRTGKLLILQNNFQPCLGLTLLLQLLLCVWKKTRTAQRLPPALLLASPQAAAAAWSPPLGKR